MRMVLLLIAIGLLVIEAGGVARTAGRANTRSLVNVSADSTPKPHVDFDRQIRPMLESKCMPCHFSGGQMYDRLPFDKPATIRKLGTKLFTRIKDEEKRRLIEDFLAQSP
jgi:hypothetical protein